jgi:hypothetical protein
MLRTASTARPTSPSLVCQPHTDTRMHRFPRQVVPPKKASPVATMRAMVESVRRSWSASSAPARGSRKRTLVDGRRRDDLGAGQGADARDQRAGVVAAALDQRREAGAAEHCAG